MKLLARTPNMDDLWQEQDKCNTAAVGGRDPTPDLEDIWDADPQRQFKQRSIYNILILMFKGFKTLKMLPDRVPSVIKILKNGYALVSQNMA